MAATLVDSIAALRDKLQPIRGSGTIGLVPTMGALHAGHASLIDRARGECDAVVVSIFVNPLQFDREEDLQRYPRTLEADLALCGERGVDVVFAPPVGEVYPSPLACVIDVGRLDDHLCGPFRPGHFQGVATVVMKLFQMAQPDRAYFGEKDAQQLAIVRRLVKDFNVPVAVVGIPTVREADGLALSSRNKQLSAEERQLATVLYRALGDADRRIASGVTDVELVKQHAAAQVPAHRLLRLEYLDVVDPEEMQPVERITGPVVVAGALWVGATRLIDNVRSAPPAGTSL